MRQAADAFTAANPGLVQLLTRGKSRNGQELFTLRIMRAELASTGKKRPVVIIDGEILTGVHCLACTAGSGSSCTGAIG